MATIVLFKLAAYTGDARYLEAGEKAIAPLQPALAQAPTAFAWWLNALEFELAPPHLCVKIAPVNCPLRMWTPCAHS